MTSSSGCSWISCVIKFSSHLARFLFILRYPHNLLITACHVLSPQQASFCISVSLMLSKLLTLCSEGNCWLMLNGQHRTVFIPETLLTSASPRMPLLLPRTVSCAVDQLCLVLCLTVHSLYNQDQTGFSSFPVLWLLRRFCKESTGCSFLGECYDRSFIDFCGKPPVNYMRIFFRDLGLVIWTICLSCGNRLPNARDLYYTWPLSLLY